MSNALSSSSSGPRFTRGDPISTAARPPEPLETATAILDGGSTVEARRHGNPDGPRLVLSHGCGFASDLYWPFWSLLIDDFGVLVYDLRSHGWNEPTNLRFHNIPILADDNRRVIEAVNATFGSKPIGGIYHSRQQFLPDCTHFLQLEAPETCAAMTTEFMRQAGLLG